MSEKITLNRELQKKYRNLVLDIEPIPYWSKYKNAHTKILSKRQWKLIQDYKFNQANHKCEICGNEGPLNCHEIWKFTYRKNRIKSNKFTIISSDEPIFPDQKIIENFYSKKSNKNLSQKEFDNKFSKLKIYPTQVLLKFIALCDLCHIVKHYDNAKIDETDNKLFMHFKTINNLTEEEATILIKYFRQIRFERYYQKFDIDMSILHEYLYKLDYDYKSLQDLVNVKF